MQTYLKNTDRQPGELEFIAVRASRAEVSKLHEVASGKWQIVPSTRTLRNAAKLNINVKVCAIGAAGLRYL